MNDSLRIVFPMTCRYVSVGLLCCFYSSAADCLALFEKRVSIDIKGDIDAKLHENIFNHLSITAIECQSPEWRVKSLFALSDREIQNALQAFGYYQGTAAKNLRRDNACWDVTFTVSPGPRVRIKTVEIELDGEAREDAVFLNLLPKLPLKNGMPLNHGDYEQSKALMQELALQRGYFDSRFSVHELRVNPEKLEAAIRLHFDSGPRYRFGRITIDQDVLKPEFVSRMVTIRAGDPYDTQKLSALNLDLSNSAYFAQIDIKPRTQEADNLEVPVDIGLTAMKRHYYRFGAGADTDTGPRLTAGYENRRVNRRGHRFKADLKASIVLSEASLEYRIPWDKPISDYFALQSGYRHEKTDNLETDKVLAGGKFVYLLENRWLSSVGLFWTREKFTAGLQEGEATLIVPETTWARRVTDDDIWIRNGYALNFELRGSYEALFSDLSFFQAKSSFDAIEQLPWKWSGRFIGRAELGLIHVGDFSRLPVSYRFFAGGDQSVRGYNYKEIGPTDASGEAIGGRYLATFSIEYEQPVTENWGVAAFVDTGSVTESFDFSFRTGVGLGVRWHTLIGPLRADVAVPLSEADDSFRIHFSMGPEF